MNRKAIIVFVIFLLVFVDLVFIMLCTGLNKNLNLVQNKYEVLLTQDSLNEKMYIKNILQYTINCGEKVNENLELISETGQKTTFQRLAMERPAIFFKYFLESCNSCVDSELRIMKEIFSEDDFRKIIILTTEKDPIKISHFKKMNQINNPVYIANKEDSELKIDKLGGPYMFVLNDSFYIENLFIPIKLNAAPSIEYYKHIKSLYFE